MRVFAMLILLICGLSKAQTSKPLKVHEQLEDFVVLRTSLLQNTGAPYLYIDSIRLAARFDSIQLILNKPLPSKELFKHFSFMTSQLRCGHTQCYPSKQLIKEFLYTKGTVSGDITVLNGAIYTTKTIGRNPSIPKGSRIQSINGKPAESIIDNMRRHFSADGENVTFKDRVFSELFLLYFYLTNETTDRFRITYVHPDGDERTEEVIASLPDFDYHNKKIEQSTFLSEPDPSTVGSVRVNRKKNYALFKFPSFRYSSGKRYQQFLADAVTKVNKSEVDYVVLDLRDNLGGKPQILLMGHLCRNQESFLRLSCDDIRQPTYKQHFKKWDEWYRKYKKIIRITRRSQNMGGSHFNVTLKSDDQLEKINGKLIVLINGGSFSASANLAGNLQTKCNATIIGEETGGSYVQGNTGQLLLKLPHSKMLVSINPIYYNNQIKGGTENKAGVQPDIVVKESFGQKKRDDPYMKAAENFINKK